MQVTVSLLGDANWPLASSSRRHRSFHSSRLAHYCQPVFIMGKDVSCLQNTVSLLGDAKWLLASSSRRHSSCHSSRLAPHRQLIFIMGKDASCLQNTVSLLTDANWLQAAGIQQPASESTAAASRSICCRLSFAACTAPHPRVVSRIHVSLFSKPGPQQLAAEGTIATSSSHQYLPGSQVAQPCPLSGHAERLPINLCRLALVVWQLKTCQL